MVQEEKWRAERELAASLGETYYEPIDMTQQVENVQKYKKKKSIAIAEVAVIAVLLLSVLPVFMRFFSEEQIYIAVASVAALVTMIISVRSIFLSRRLEKRDKIPASIYCLIAGIITIAIMIMNPVEDMYYYGGAIAAMIAIIFTLISLIRKYNILATRKLPQFEYTGGDERA